MLKASPDRAHLRRHGVALHAEMQVPVEIPIIVEIVAHERLVGMLRVEQLVEKVDDLGLVLRSVKIGADAGEIDALAQVVVAAILEPLEKDGHAVRGGGLPVFVKHAPEVPGDRVLFGERQVDHRQDRTLAGEDAAEKERDDGVLDIFAIEMARNRGAELGQGPGEVWRVRRSGGLACECARRNGRGAEKQRSPLQGEPGKIFRRRFHGLWVGGNGLGELLMLGHGVNSLRAANGRYLLVRLGARSRAAQVGC